MVATNFTTTTTAITTITTTTAAAAIIVSDVTTAITVNVMETVTPTTLVERERIIIQ